MNNFQRLGSALVGLQVVDGLLTMWATNHGFAEVNPLMAPIANSWMLLAVKVIPTIVVVLALLPLTRRFGKVITGGLVAGIAFLGLVVGLNIIELIGGTSI